MLQQYDERNKSIQIWVGDKLYPRDKAKVSVFDSTVQGGDAVWEGLRVYNGKIFCLDQHLNRLFHSAKALAFEGVPSKAFIIDALMQTLKANDQRDETHIRLTLSRGLKITSGMDPRLNQFGTTLIIAAEWKPPVYPPSVRLITTSQRRNSPMCLDSKIHHNNLINNVLAKIEANLAGADAGIMLDIYGFVSEANGVNIFMVKNGIVYTPSADACLPGITRATVIKICKEQALSIVERNLSIAEFYSADEVFVTGTMGELTGVSEIDGRAIENKSGNKILHVIKNCFNEMVKTEGLPLNF